VSFQKSQSTGATSPQFLFKDPDNLLTTGLDGTRASQAEAMPLVLGLVEIGTADAIECLLISVQPLASLSGSVGWQSRPDVFAGPPNTLYPSLDSPVFRELEFGLDDLDGDSQSNFDEFVAGTFVNNSSSFFAVHIDLVTPTSDQWRLSFPVKADRTYRLKAGESLDAPLSPVGAPVEINTDGQQEILQSGTASWKFQSIDAKLTSPSLRPSLRHLRAATPKRRRLCTQEGGSKMVRVSLGGRTFYLPRQFSSTPRWFPQ